VIRRAWWLGVVLLVGCDAIAQLAPGEQGEERLMVSRGSYREASTLIVGRAADAYSLDPAVPSDIDSVEVIAQIYDRLLSYQPGSGELSPGLATRWEVSEDGRAWIFSLRRDVRFHDGSRLDADAVVFSLERQRDPAHPYHPGDSSYRHHFRSIQSVDKVDDFTVRVTIERQYSPFLATMAIFAAAIVSPHAVARWGDRYADHPVGTGPFRLVSWSRGNRIVLERNDDYWGPRPAFRRLVFEVIPDPRQRLVALESGSIDMAHAIAPEEVLRVSTARSTPTSWGWRVARASRTRCTISVG
jgi:peptide/nickel transport system substrate-binding protein